MHEGGGGGIEKDGADLLITQGQQGGVGAVETQAGEAAVGLIQNAVAVFIQSRQLGKPVAAAGTEQLAAIVDLAVTIAIEGQKGGVVGQLRQALTAAIGIEIKFKTG